ncbi:MAG: IS66 family insertion sequence element accessory protein TnpB [Myxococcota bacterium]
MKVFLATAPASLANSIDGLVAEVERRFGEDAMSGHVYAFLNRAGTGAKLIFWSNGGFVCVYKRLERGRFRVPAGGGARVAMTHAELAALLDGIDLSRARRLPLWNPGNLLDSPAGPR